MSYVNQEPQPIRTELVAQFMQAAGQLTEVQVQKLYLALILEETAEYLLEFNSPILQHLAHHIIESKEHFLVSEELPIPERDEPNAFKEWLDTIWVLIGYAHARNWPIEKGFEALAKSNLDKVDLETGRLIKNEFGKVLKPAHWKPFNAAEILNNNHSAVPTKAPPTFGNTPDGN